MPMMLVQGQHSWGESMEHLADASSPSWPNFVPSHPSHPQRCCFLVFPQGHTHQGLQRRRFQSSDPLLIQRHLSAVPNHCHPWVYVLAGSSTFWGLSWQTLAGSLMHLQSPGCQLGQLTLAPCGLSSSKRLAWAASYGGKRTGRTKSLGLRLRTDILSLLPRSISQNKSPGQPRIKRWEKRTSPQDRRSCKVTLQRTWVQKEGGDTGSFL